MEEKMHATVPLQMMFGGWLAGWLAAAAERSSS